MPVTAGRTLGPKDELIRLIYRAVLEPDNFMDFVEVLQEASAVLEGPDVTKGMVAHLEVASNLADQNNLSTTNPTICSIYFDAELVLLKAEERAEKEFDFLFSKLTAGEPLGFHSSELEDAITDNIEALERESGNKKLLTLEVSGRRCCCYLGQTDHHHFVLTLLRNHFLDEFDLSASLLGGLTKTERSVCLSLFEGLTPPEVAEKLIVAPSTIKSHIKSIFSKLGVNRQVDLIRLMDQAFLLEREFEQVLSDPEALSGKCLDEVNLVPARVATDKNTVLGNTNRKIAFRDYGPRDGRPIAYFHGSFSSGLLSDTKVEELFGQNLRVIAVDRPGYGGTDPATVPDVQIATNDVGCVLDSLGLEEIDALGFGKGAFFALRLAQENFGRVKSITLCSTSFGTNSSHVKPDRPAQVLDAFLRQFPGVAKAMASFYLRRVSDSVSRRRIKRTWEGSPPDKAALEDEALISYLVDCGHEAVSKGVDGIVYDYLSLRDAEIDLGCIRQPVTAFHGGHDISLSISQVRSLLSPLPDLRLIAKRDKGQLMFHTDFGEIVEMMSRQ